MSWDGMGYVMMEDAEAHFTSNVMASAFRSRTGASFALIDLVRRERIRMLATPPLFLEYEDVLKRPEQLAVSHLSLADVDTAPWMPWRP
jgi:hypothetical protein